MGENSLISIIGSGRVGSAVAYLVASTALDDILLVNRTKTKAIGESLDISNTIPEGSSISVEGTDDYSLTKDSKLVVITASAAVYTKSRTEMIGEQIKMVKDIAKKIKTHTPNSKIIMVSNPLDVLTYVFLKETGFSREQVIGVASSLDTSRFRYLLAKEFAVPQSEIRDALVLGEHGDSMVPIFSRAKKNETPVLELLDSAQIEQITNNLKNYWTTLREYKSRSVFGIGKNTFDVVESMIKEQNLSIPSSVLLNGEYGISDVCLGVPTKLSKDGLDGIDKIKLEENELDSLQKSAKIIKNYILTATI
ncbi:MAG TPA: lactate dehydrogenase [Nitrosopumilaceae archaeon]|nr:lactate dehydrogenase [Nitrosopumilaceae archaeon]